jgi:hypothetical protein
MSTVQKGELQALTFPVASFEVLPPHAKSICNTWTPCHKEHWPP